MDFLRTNDFAMDERETSLLWDKETQAWDCWSNEPKHIRLFCRIAEAHGQKPEFSPDGRMRVNLPEKAISFRRPITRVVTEEQREAARQRLKAMRENQR